MSDASNSTDLPIHEPPMTLVSVRIPSGDLDALRLAARAKNQSVAHLIRSGVRRELSKLRRDPGFIEEIRSRRDELDRLVADLEESELPTTKEATTDTAPESSAVASNS